MFCVTTVKPVVPKCSVPKSVPFGKSAELSCVEEEGFPKSQYQWFKNREEIPDDPKTSVKFFNSSYTLSAETGTLVSTCAYVFGQGHTWAARVGKQRWWPDAQGWGQIFWGDSRRCEKAWATRGICCPRLHIPQFSLAFQPSSICSVHSAWNTVLPRLLRRDTPCFMGNSSSSVARRSCKWIKQVFLLRLFLNFWTVMFSLSMYSTVVTPMCGNYAADWNCSN